MAVNLTGIELNGPAIGPARKTALSQNNLSGSSESPPEAGDVNITSTAALLAQLEQSLSAQPAVDQNRVDAVSQAIAAGRYHVSADLAASGLVSTERALAALPLGEI